MGKSRPPWEERTTALIDEIGAVNRVLWRSQAQQAALMVEFCAARKTADKQLIAANRSDGRDPLFRAGEFAAGEVSMAVKTSKYTTQRTIAMTRRVQAEAPDVWDAWAHGDIDHDKVVRINRALRRLVHDGSKALLNTLVGPVAIEKTPEILGRWLNGFITQVEPDDTDERLNRALADRYVSVRPDLDGISFLHAAISSVDAVAVDQLLNAVASIVEPGDDRTKQQRRADTLVDLLCGRIGNGWHPGFDTNSDTDDHLDDDSPPTTVPDSVVHDSAAPDGENHPANTADNQRHGDETCGDGADLPVEIHSNPINDVTATDLIVPYVTAAGVTPSEVTTSDVNTAPGTAAGVTASVVIAGDVTISGINVPDGVDADLTPTDVTLPYRVTGAGPADLGTRESDHRDAGEPPDPDQFRPDQEPPGPSSTRRTGTRRTGSCRRRRSAPTHMTPHPNQTRRSAPPAARARHPTSAQALVRRPAANLARPRPATRHPGSVRCARRR